MIPEEKEKKIMYGYKELSFDNRFKILMVNVAYYHFINSAFKFLEDNPEEMDKFLGWSEEGQKKFLKSCVDDMYKKNFKKHYGPNTFFDKYYRKKYRHLMEESI